MPVGIGGELGWWCPSLDDGGNGTNSLNDLSGNSRHGTLTNMETGDWTADTTKGGSRCLVLDGVDEFVNVPSNLGVTNYPFSSSCWVSPANNSQVASFVTLCQYVISSGQYLSLETRSGLYSIVARNTAFNNAAGGTIAANTWTHLAGVWESDSLWRLFVNGALVATGAVTVAFPTGMNAFLIGKLRNDATGVFNGRIDDVRAFGRVLTVQEINALASRRAYQPDTENDLINGGLFNKSQIGGGLCI